jgi:hypothetical protein
MAGPLDEVKAESMAVSVGHFAVHVRFPQRRLARKNEKALKGEGHEAVDFPSKPFNLLFLPFGGPVLVN